jgi:hypothetical protein
MTNFQGQSSLTLYSLVFCVRMGMFNTEISEFVTVFAKLGIPLLASLCLSVCPRGTTRLPLGRFSWNLIFEYFSKICRENSSIIRNGQEKEALYMKTKVEFWSCHAWFFSEWEMFQIKIVEIIITHISCSINVFDNLAVYEIMWNDVVQPDRSQMTIWRMRIAVWITKSKTHTRTRTQNMQ